MLELAEFTEAAYHATFPSLTEAAYDAAFPSLTEAAYDAAFPSLTEAAYDAAFCFSQPHRSFFLLFLASQKLPTMLLFPTQGRDLLPCSATCLIFKFIFIFSQIP